MAYQPSPIIQYQNHPSRRIVVVPFNPQLVGDKEFHSIPRNISQRVNSISATGFRTHYDISVQHVNHCTTDSLSIDEGRLY